SQLSITGFLSYYDDQFLQYIEGEKKALDELMGFITTDVRHTILEVCRTSVVIKPINSSSAFFSPSIY
ncbi:MAG: BLUF domain-containing protein, partial [Bacteroidota bacterium]